MLPSCKQVDWLRPKSAKQMAKLQNTLERNCLCALQTHSRILIANEDELGMPSKYYSVQTVVFNALCL